jgi:hypothetical protein
VRAAAAILVMVGWAQPASAHLGHVVLRAERYLKIDATASEARLVVSLTLGPSEGRRVLEAADADGDRTVTRAEADAYMAQWGEGLETDLPVTVDREPVDVAWGEAYFDPIGAVRETPMTVEMVAHIPLDGGRRAVTMRDAMRREAFDRTDVAFRARDGAELVASGLTAEPMSITPTLAYGPDLPAPEGGHFITAVVELPLCAPEGPPWWAWIAGGATLLAAAAAYAALRRRRG